MARRRSFIRDTCGLSAMEFAFCAPIFIMLLLAGTDTLRYYMLSDNVDAAAESVAELIAEHRTGAINYQDIQFYHDSAMLAVPSLLSAAFKSKVTWDSTISLSMASVDFGAAQSGCGDTCTYVPKMVWSGGTAPRSCTVSMIAADDNSSPSPTTLPTHIYGPGSIVIVDIVYQFQPLFQVKYFPAIAIKRSYYISPRFVPLIKYQTISGDNSIVKPCDGYAYSS